LKSKKNKTTNENGSKRANEAGRSAVSVGDSHNEQTGEQRSAFEKRTGEAQLTLLAEP